MTEALEAFVTAYWDADGGLRGYSYRSGLLDFQSCYMSYTCQTVVADFWALLHFYPFVGVHKDGVFSSRIPGRTARFLTMRCLTVLHR